jgi:hypothetical protein
MKPREFVQVDPASLHLPSSRRDGADPVKLHRQPVRISGFQAEEDTMNAIRVHARIESDTLHLPELRQMIGKTVQITILEEAEPADSPMETSQTFFGNKPKHSLSAEEREADHRRLEEIAKRHPGMAAVLRIAEAGGPDVDAIVSQRARG